jgi:hypothetical protein
MNAHDAADPITRYAGPQEAYMPQLQAKWLSIVGKIDSKHELKTTLDGTKCCPSTLTFNDHQWKPTECPIDPTLATYKYVSIHLDLSCENTDT